MRQIVHAEREHGIARDRIDEENAGVGEAAPVGIAMLDPLAQHHEDRETP